MEALGPAALLLLAAALGCSAAGYALSGNAAASPAVASWAGATSEARRILGGQLRLAGFLLGLVALVPSGILART